MIIRFLYHIAMHVLGLILKIRGLFHQKTKQWNQDRQNHFNSLTDIKAQAGQKNIFWMHCASLGEYEQGLPVLRYLKESFPEAFILLSFFSPSGYLQKKDTKEADQVIYLPLDTLNNAKQIVKLLNPTLFVGVKYEFWWNLLWQLNINGTNLIYISLYLHQPKLFLQIPYFKNILNNCKIIFTQDENTSNILKEHGLLNVKIGVDTRTPSVCYRKESISKLLNDTRTKMFQKNMIVYGSIYMEDVTIVREFLHDPNYLHVVVPHHVDDASLADFSTILPDHIRWSLLKEGDRPNVIMIDTIGILFDLYRYAAAAYIGGGFGRSVHNTLEPAVFGLPISFGPKNKGFVEIQDFINLGLAYEVRNKSDFEQFIKKINGSDFDEAKKKVGAYFVEKIEGFEMMKKDLIQIL